MNHENYIIKNLSIEIFNEFHHKSSNSDCHKISKIVLLRTCQLKCSVNFTTNHFKILFWIESTLPIKMFNEFDRKLFKKFVFDDFIGIQSKTWYVCFKWKHSNGNIKILFSIIFNWHSNENDCLFSIINKHSNKNKLKILFSIIKLTFNRKHDMFVLRV